MNAPDLTRMALRGLGIPSQEREERLAKASPDTQRALKAEMDAIQWFVTLYLVWSEQGTWENVLAYAKLISETDAVEAA